MGTAGINESDGGLRRRGFYRGRLLINLDSYENWKQKLKNNTQKRKEKVNTKIYV